MEWIQSLSYYPVNLIKALTIILTSLLMLASTDEQNLKEMNRCQDMLKSLSSKVNQMAASLNMSSFNNRDSVLVPNIKQYDIINRTNGLNNCGLVGFCWQITKGMWFLPGCMLLYATWIRVYTFVIWVTYYQLK